jgi:3-deoxy-manno-octulosonate cytidylyltransferase (CMP-KDO synthetase)
LGTKGATLNRSSPTASVVGAIPARYASTRFPGKPLVKLAGRTMIQHVYERAARVAELERVVVLTDDERIATAVDDFGGQWQMTPADCSSGTDRIAWAARGWRTGAVINIQGDEPLIDPVGIRRLAVHLREHPEDRMVTLAAPADEEEREDPNVVKVVMDRSGRALYFSRAPIPFPRFRGEAPVWRHLGIYGYRKETLLELAGAEPTPLERSEGLEQLGGRGPGGGAARRRGGGGAMTTDQRPSEEPIR